MAYGEGVGGCGVAVGNETVPIKCCFVGCWMDQPVVPIDQNTAGCRQVITLFYFVKEPINLCKLVILIDTNLRNSWFYFRLITNNFLFIFVLPHFFTFQQNAQYKYFVVVYQVVKL